MQQISTSDMTRIAMREAFAVGHYGKASRILKQALEESNEIGVVDESIVGSAHSLAERYLLAGDYSGAASLYRAVLEVRKRVLGDDHPDVRESTRKLALALWHTGGLSPTTTVTE